MTAGPTPALSWGEYIAKLSEEHGSLAALAQKLSRAKSVDADAATVERALRRLRVKGHRDGGQYGQLLLRTFGMPREVEHRAKWMGVYHSRFTDLPVSLCLDQLRLWDRPPLAESRSRTWIELGLATCALRLEEWTQAEHHLGGARGGHGIVAARVEARLLEAYLASRKGERAKVIEILDDLEASLHDAALEPEERASLHARWLDQRAYQLLHPPSGEDADIAGAKILYERIADRDAPLFAACKRESGLAYVYFRSGDRARAISHAENACTHAGDGGFTRLRIAALGLLTHILGEPAGATVRARAMRAARGLEDEDLMARLRRAEIDPSPPRARISRARGSDRAGS